jgi:hypothetical protein
MIPDRNDVEYFSSFRSNVVLANKTYVEYTGIGLFHIRCRMPIRDIAILLLHRILFVQSLRKSIYS